MAKFIMLTEAGGQGRSIAINLDTVEYILHNPNGGTEVVSVTHHTKYRVRESMNDIMNYLDDLGLLLTIKPAKETSPTMEVVNNEDHCI